MKNEVENNEMNSVKDGDLEKISGGYVYRNGNRRRRARQYEVIDDDSGKVLISCSNLENAKRLANMLGQSEKKIGYSTLYKIRKHQR